MPSSGVGLVSVPISANRVRHLDENLDLTMTMS